MFTFKTNRENLYVSLFLLAIFIVYSNADIGFSFDYQFYINDFKSISSSTFSNLFSNLNGIYILLDESKFTVGREVGFVIFIKLISYLISSPELIYAVAAIFSLTIKAYIMRKIGIYWPYIFLILLYSAILLEGNALRSGISLSIFMLSIFLLLRKKSPLTILFLWLIAFSLHLQSLFFIFTFATIFMLSLNRYSNFVTLLFFLALMFTGIMASQILGYFTSGKILSYLDINSASGGLNLRSIISLFLLIFVTRTFIVNSSFRKKNNIIFALVSCTIPALSIFIFLTDVAVVGDRLWQWGFIILAVYIYPYYSEFKLINFKNNIRLHIPKFLIISLLSISLINITIRYPLTNLLYPITPYVDFTDRSLIGRSQ